MEQTYPAAVYNRSISKRNFWIDDFGDDGKYMSDKGGAVIAVIIYFGVTVLLALGCCFCGCMSEHKKRRRQRRLQAAANPTPATLPAGSQHCRQGNQGGPSSGRMGACFSRSRNAYSTNDNEASHSRNGGLWFSRSRNTANNNSNSDIEMGRFRRTLSRALSMNKPSNLSNISPAAPIMPLAPTFPVPVEPPPVYQPPTTIPTTVHQPPITASQSLNSNQIIAADAWSQPPTTTPTAVHQPPITASQSLNSNQIIAADAWSLRTGTPPPLFEEREWDILHEEEVAGVRTQGVQYDRPLPQYSLARRDENGAADDGWWDRRL